MRNLLGRMHVEFVEANGRHAQTDFCGCSLYRPQMAPPKLALRHYAQEAQGTFLPHTEEEQWQMQAYCSRYTTETVVCYCLKGLEVGGMDAWHIAHMLFPENG